MSCPASSGAGRRYGVAACGQLRPIDLPHTILLSLCCHTCWLLCATHRPAVELPAINADTPQANHIPDQQDAAEAATTMSDADKRTLKVKAGVVRRLHKELGMYQAEVETEGGKVQRLKDAGADPHDIKYAENILAESSAMLPDTRQRLEEAFRDLQGLVEEFSGSLAGSEELAAAQEQVTAAQQLFA
ncbi:Tubulin-folding cofactor A [Chlorella vulgaris]